MVDESKQLIRLEKFISDIHLSIEKMVENEHAQILWNFTEVEEIVTIKSYLHSIFFNLISNSLKYRKPDETPMIKITSRRMDGKIVLLFEDNGIGIDLSTAGEHVFGLYKRFHTDGLKEKEWDCTW
jgi:light-regulated signal transduction histidine kinase (bacteriophytochrome)